MTYSVRVRLTAWNGGLLTVVLLGFCAAAYVLLARSLIEQIDQSVRLQLATMQLTIRAHEDAHDPGGLTSVVTDLQERGFRVFADTAARVLATRSIPGPGVIARMRKLTGGDPSRTGALPAPLLAAIRERDARRAMGPFSVQWHDVDVRVRLEHPMIAGHRYALAATEPLDEVDQVLGRVRRAIVVGVPLVVALALVVGYLVARRALAPVAAMTAQAQRIGDRTLHERLKVATPNDELGRLADTFNAVLARAERALEQQRRLTADASHELRTPIAIIRSEADVALAGEGRTAAEYRDSLEVIRDGSAQLSRIVSDLFLLARADAGQVAIVRRPIYLDELVTDTVRRMRTVGASRGIEIAVDAQGEASFDGDEELLRRVLVNLLDNAMRHAPEGSTVDVSLRSAPDGHRIVVSDRGPGVPAESRALVFERFYRADTERRLEPSAHGTGAGLGLAIAREIVAVHGGRLTLLDTDRGAAFELFLPASHGSQSRATSDGGPRSAMR